MPESAIKVRQDLQQYFSPTFQKSAHFETYVRIGSYLSDQMQYEAGLSILEYRMDQVAWQRAEEFQKMILAEKGLEFDLLELRNLLFEVRAKRFDGEGALSSLEKVLKPYADLFCWKLLSGVLYEWERDNGFTQDPWGKVDILIGNPGKLFNDHLKDGRAFKDIGAGRQHGEFTHRIQWFIAGVGLMLPNAGALYRDVARFISVEQLQNEQSDPMRRYLWEFLFDRDGDPSNAASIYFKCVDRMDFRAPSNLNRYLTEEPSTPFPVLCWCLKDRLNKRMRKAPGLDYIAKKAPNDQYAGPLGALATHGIKSGEDLDLFKSAQGGLFVRRPGRGQETISWQTPPKK